MRVELGRNVSGINALLKNSVLAGLTVLLLLAVPAAAQDKLDNEFLVSRGIRVTDTRFMCSAFRELPTPEGTHVVFPKSVNRRGRSYH